MDDLPLSMTMAPPGLNVSGFRGLPIKGHLAWKPSDPLAVSLVLVDPDDPDDRVTWVFARDLLKAGLDEVSGYGDVTVMPDVDPDTDRWGVMLSSPDGVCLVRVSGRAAARRWLARTYTLVPAGAELVPVNTWLRKMGLSSATAPGDAEKGTPYA